MNSEKILFIEPCNFVKAPLGGQLSQARMLLRSLGDRLSLVGWTDDPFEPIGKWYKREIGGVEFDFFSTRYVPNSNFKKPKIPIRALSWWDYKRFGKAALSCGIRNILLREPTTIMALPFNTTHNICFWMPGVEPSLSVSRFKWAKAFSSLYDTFFMLSLKRHARTILAAADAEAIDKLKERSRGRLDEFDIKEFPTRLDTNLFKPGNKATARERLSIPLDATLVVTSGRLNSSKGWRLLIDAFSHFTDKYENAIFYFIGDGSDRDAIRTTVQNRGLSKKIFLAGQQSQKQLACYLRAADLFVMGSEKEGWSTSLVEALSSALPIVTTRFSSADTIVKNGINGFIVPREPEVLQNQW
jgi:glycosyltransferase involved in cell wall biosynthesis